MLSWYESSLLHGAFVLFGAEILSEELFVSLPDTEDSGFSIQQIRDGENLPKIKQFVACLT